MGPARRVLVMPYMKFLMSICLLTLIINKEPFGQVSALEPMEPFYMIFSIFILVDVILFYIIIL